MCTLARLAARSALPLAHSSSSYIQPGLATTVRHVAAAAVPGMPRQWLAARAAKLSLWHMLAEQATPGASSI
jgi:hypothetical protein